MSALPRQFLLLLIPHDGLSHDPHTINTLTHMTLSLSHDPHTINTLTHRQTQLNSKYPNQNSKSLTHNEHELLHNQISSRLTKLKILRKHLQFHYIPFHFFQEIPHLGEQIICNTKSQQPRWPYHRINHFLIRKPQNLQKLNLWQKGIFHTWNQ